MPNPHSHPRLLDLIRADGQANLGASLLRLARLAESAHRHEAAMQLAALANTAGEGLDQLKPPGRVAPGSGAGKDAALVNSRSGGSSTHTEVRR